MPECNIFLKARIPVEIKKDYIEDIPFEFKFLTEEVSSEAKKFKETLHETLSELGIGLKSFDVGYYIARVPVEARITYSKSKEECREALRKVRDWCEESEEIECIEVRGSIKETVEIL